MLEPTIRRWLKRYPFLSRLFCQLHRWSLMVRYWLRRPQLRSAPCFVPPTHFIAHPLAPVNLYTHANAEGIGRVFDVFHAIAESRVHSEEYVFVWSERVLSHPLYPAGLRPLIFEFGWLPRSTYQLSPAGANFNHHALMNFEQRDWLALVGEQNLEKARRLAASALKPLPELAWAEEPFFVVALQTGNDINLRESQSAYTECYSPDLDASYVIAQRLIDELSPIAERVGAKLVFCQHPADFSGREPNVPSPHLYVSKSQGVSTASLVALKACRGALAINSNLLHEALALGKPACALGRLMLPKEVCPVNGSAESFFEDPVYPVAVENYLAFLLAHEWLLSDFQHPLIVRELLEDPYGAVPIELRRKHQLV